MKNILGIIPARGGSKGLHKKNLKLLKGKPLIWYTIFTARKSKYLSQIVVSTEDKDIAEYVTTLGIRVVERPIELAQDTSLVVDALKHTVKFLELNYRKSIDALVCLNPTSPMRTVQSLDKALELLIQGNHDSVFSAKVALESDRINYGNWFAENGNLKPCYDHRNMKNRQDVSYKKIIHENGSIYALKKEVLFNSNGFGGKNPGYIAMSNEEAIDIDNEYHFRIAELYYDEFFKDNFVV